MSLTERMNTIAHLSQTPPRRLGGHTAQVLIATLSLLFIGGWSTSLRAEITDSEDSASYLASQIAVSSGGTTSQYMIYSRGLAKTLSQLSPTAQERVLESSSTAGTGGDMNSTSGGGSFDPGDSEYGSSDWWAKFWDWLKNAFG